MTDLPEPRDEEIMYEDDKLYCCLARYPKTEGHTVVVWKDDVEDLHLLSKEDYEYLMDTIDEVRNALLETLGIEKVYLIYMDETKHVHWHLVPRFNEKGYDILEHDPKELTDFKLAGEIEDNLNMEV
jgi:diadenosine tetraphosphate (Ap4A) HIT family hydrolase